MAVKSPGGRGKEGFPVTCIIGTSIQPKYFENEEAKNHCSNDQICLYKFPSRDSDLWGALDAMEEVRPSSFREKFSNCTSTMDIDVDDRHFDNSDSDDETESYLPNVSTGIINDGGEKVAQKGSVRDEDNTTDSRRAKRGRVTSPPQETEESTQFS
ncbi:hypothetical protein Fot_12563 [Forsythia ovata]|uniref:Uncharacterized protein n=1 Tax=Forsythia ovata TaxID=205694 RepID=A0ABD1WQS2_9LAMI